MPIETCEEDEDFGRDCDAGLAQDTDRDPFVMGCDTPGCLMPGPHFLSECHTVENLEAMEASTPNKEVNFDAERQ